MQRCAKSWEAHSLQIGGASTTVGMSLPTGKRGYDIIREPVSVLSSFLKRGDCDGAFGMAIALELLRLSRHIFSVLSIYFSISKSTNVIMLG